MAQKTVLSIIFILCYNFSFSQRITSREEYIDRYRVLAIMEMQRSGVPASITLAQACLESNNGNSRLSKASNNHFGIKCKSYWTGKTVYYDDDEKNECFRSYDSVEDSYRDHSDFLISNPRYSNLFRLDITDFKGWAHGLKRYGYATNPRYAEHLIRIIEAYKLYKYDQGIDPRKLAALERRSFADPKRLVNPYQTRKAVLRNGLKSIVVKAGDSLAGIATEFGLKTWQLQKYNDYPRDRVPRENEIMYIEPKKKRADRSTKIYVLKEGETMHYVSQMFGIKLGPLSRRNRMDDDENPKAGTVIYLRHKKPRK